jgi:8-oxo-dGTP diphosphatase
MIKHSCIKAKVSVNCIIEKDKKFLLVQQARPSNSRGRWSFPGGKVNKGETFKEAVSRELREETGLSAIKINYLGCRQEEPYKTIKHFFVVKVKDSKICFDKKEILNVAWFSLAEIKNKKVRKPWVLDSLLEYSKKKS